MRSERVRESWFIRYAIYMEIIFGLTAALCFGCADFCARFSTRTIGTYRTLFYLQCVGFLALSLYLLFTGELFRLGELAGWQPWAWGVVSSCIDALGYVALYRAFSVGKLVVIAPITASYAAVTVLLSVLTGEHLNPLQGLGIVAILLGVALAALGHEEQVHQSTESALGNEEHAEQKQQSSAGTAQTSGGFTRTRRTLPPGVGWALAAALALGLTFWLLGFFVTPALGQIVPIWLFRLTALLLLTPLALFRPKRLRLPSRSSLILVSCVGLLDTAAFVASAFGFASGDVAIVSVLASLYSAVTALLAAIFLRERLRVIQWLGIALLLTGVVFTHL